MRVVIALFVVSVVCVSGAAAQDWSQYQKDPSNTGGVVGETGTSGWTYTTNETVTTPVVRSGDRVYFGDATGRFFALDAETRTIDWSVSTAGEDLLYGSATLRDGRVYVPDSTGAITAHDLTGRQKWRFATRNISLATPAVGADTVFYSDVGSVYGIDRSSGAGLWERDLEYTSPFSPTLGDSLYIGTIQTGEAGGRYGSNGSLLALDPVNGSLRWQVTGAGVVTTPAVGHGTVYVATFDNGLQALHATNGSVRWARRTKTSEVSSPVMHDGSVFYGTGDGELVAVDADDGSTEWRLERTGDMTISPAAVEGRLYAANRAGRIWSVNTATGNVEWRDTVQPRISSLGVTARGKTVYLGTSTGVVAAVRPRSDGDTATEERTLPNASSVDPLIDPPRERVAGQSNRDETEDGDRPEDGPSSENDEGRAPIIYVVYPLIVGVIAAGAIGAYVWKRQRY